MFIPGEAEIKGTVCCFSDETRRTLLGQIENVCRSVCAAKGCSCNSVFDYITPGVFNAERETRLARAAIAELGYTVLEQTRQTVSEDFAYISRKVPACFFSLGTGSPEKGLTASNHSPDFDIDENGLRVGLESLLSIYMKCVDLG